MVLQNNLKFIFQSTNFIFKFHAVFNIQSLYKIDNLFSNLHSIMKLE